MAKRKYRIVFKKSSLGVKAVILVTILISTIALVTLHATIDQTNNNIDLLRQQAGKLEENNDSLNQQIENIGTLDSIIQLAIERLGLVPPDTTIFESGN